VSKALYRKYRSKTLDEIIGQKHITDILSRALSQGRTSHAYLFTGPRGVGKTSVARILAHAINGLPYDEVNTNLDIIEIDAASNNGVDNIRDLREKVQVAPVSANKKVYIIDEVHMLSKPAFNALLKTLEEPPEHIVFILATTNIENLPATIISRVQQFSFRPINIDDAVKHLSNIAKLEHIKITDEALKLVAIRGDGSFRDSISLLDQLSSLVEPKKTISAELIEDTLGMAPAEVINQLIESVENKNIKELIKLLNDTTSAGINPIILANQLTVSICSLIAEKPQLLILLDELINVAKSPQPQLKLLSILGLAAIPKQTPKSVALSTPIREVSASIAELEKKATKHNPIKPAKKSKFDWDKLVEYARKNHIAIHSVLSKCNYKLDDDNLTIYTGNKFYKKKLDDTKYSPLLSKCMQEVGIFGLNVHTIPTTIPPQNSQIAAIADIMGGGVEVSLDTE
jgi:DNA polymerase-3 subunit gamma/tau